MRQFALLLLLLTIGLRSAAQTSTHRDSLRAAWRDSMWTVWADTTRPTNERTEALGRSLYMDTVLTPAAAAIRVLHVAALDTTMAAHRRQYGLAYLAFGRQQSWLDHYGPALRCLRSASALLASVNRLDQAQVLLEIGRVHLIRGELEQAIQNLQPGVAAMRAVGDTDLAYLGMGNIAYALELQGNWELGLQYCAGMRALLNGTHPDKIFYLDLREGALHIGAGHPDAALAAMRQAQALVDSNGVKDLRDDIGSLTGQAMLLQGDCAGGLARLERCLAVSEGMPDRQDMVAFLYVWIAKAHLCAKHYDLALRAAKHGLLLAEQHGFGKEAIDNLKNLSEAYEGKGDITKALEYSKRYHLLNDSLLNGRTATAVTSALLTADFQHRQFADSLAAVQRAEREHLVAEQRLDKERARRNIVLVAGAGLLAFSLLLYRQRRRIREALRRSDDLLLNILPAAVADELKAKGEAVTRQIDQVTVLFTDFKGFTAMSEKLTPKELVRDIHECFSAFDHIMAKHGIEKIKTIGDAYMAAGGLPTPNNTHPVDVVKAALEVRDFIEAGKALKIAKGLPYFEIRIGVHTGPVVAGIVGVKKFAYDIWGDTVNIASRMESSGEVGQVNISEATYALIKVHPGLTFTPRGKIQAKGKGEMEMYFVGSN